LKIVADFEDGKGAAIRNVENDLRCYKEILTEMKPRIQQIPVSFFKYRYPDDS
jgi:hypothetical protein